MTCDIKDEPLCLEDETLRPIGANPKYIDDMDTFRNNMSCVGSVRRSKRTAKGFYFVADKLEIYKSSNGEVFYLLGTRKKDGKYKEELSASPFAVDRFGWIRVPLITAAATYIGWQRAAALYKKKIIPPGTVDRPPVQVTHISENLPEEFVVQLSLLSLKQG